MKSLSSLCHRLLFLILGLTLLPAAAQNRGEHVLTAGDTIEVRVFQEADLDARVLLSQDGKVSLPLVGEVTVAGLNITEASRAIAARYKDGYLVNPSVTVTMGEYAKRRFTILGAVNKPGSFYFPPGENLNLLQVIGMAGGYSRIANPSRIQLKRGNAAKPIMLDGKKMAKTGEAASYLILPGDILEVKESLW